MKKLNLMWLLLILMAFFLPLSCYIPEFVDIEGVWIRTINNDERTLEYLYSTAKAEGEGENAKSAKAISTPEGTTFCEKGRYIQNPNLPDDANKKENVTSFACVVDGNVEGNLITWVIIQTDSTEENEPIVYPFVIKQKPVPEGVEEDPMFYRVMQVLNTDTNLITEYTYRCPNFDSL